MLYGRWQTAMFGIGSLLGAVRNVERWVWLLSDPEGLQQCISLEILSFAPGFRIRSHMTDRGGSCLFGSFGCYALR